ncbi:MAG: efflux RND transporter periplasmic adaptor subunit [Mariniblastus sp.]|nr:efflux RND transporter periplasmic adaptor subunit [Mariniblastus sp.]
MNPRSQPWTPLFSAFASGFLLMLAGCIDDSVSNIEPNAKPPKPVSTLALKQTSPSFQHYTTASVAPWKSEQIGFEQPGRVIQVIEPNEMVKGQWNESLNTPLAQLDDEQFQISVDAAKADAAVAERRSDSNLIAINQRLPALIKTAEAERQLAENELARAESLADSISKSEVDRARTRASTSNLRVESARSELAQSNAEQLALEAQVQQATQRLAEAKRNLRNTILFSSFPGQVSEVHAVPGTYVKEGDPIVTVQMVDPMLVEFEVTADNSRLYQRGDTLGVTVTNGNGEQQRLTGMVYTVDTIADTKTRTFTVSLHVRNQPESKLHESPGSETFARTKNIFPLNIGPIVTGDQRLLVEQNSIHQIDGDNFVWKISNREWSVLSEAGDRVLIVERIKVKVTSEVIPFLGTWNFVAIEFEDPSSVDLEQDLITGKLFFKPEAESTDVASLKTWSGDRVLIEQTRWRLRAGDTVRVALISENSDKGFYVPMKAIRRENGTTFIHIVSPAVPQTEATSAKVTAQRVRVNVVSNHAVSEENLMLCIEPLNPDQLQEGAQVIIGGTHYLDDGDRIRIVPRQRLSQGGR